MAELNVGNLFAKIRIDDSGVSATLSKIKRDLSELRKEAEGAVKLKVDASGAASSVEKTKRELEEVRKQAEQTSKTKIDVAPKGTAELDKAGQSAEKTAKALDEASKKKPDVTPKGTSELNKASDNARQLGQQLDNAKRSGSSMTVSKQPAEELDNATDKASKFGGVLSSIGSMAASVGVGAAIGGVGAAFSQSLRLGNEYTNNLNVMSAVSGATATQLEAVSQRARELGSDASLASTSASDAAAAMSELAKGGFTVAQSMEAAKGTLQLAASAGIDAASAATIQSQALQSFGLNADYAAKSSDVLSNAANQSSAEITGIAQGLQASGAVANQFGLTLEDTSATLAMLANAGIQGSDAGTLLKSTLLALTDQGKPAQEAIEKLGLTVYDSSGQFVGMSSLMGQLEEASRNMTEEQYQAAAATLFGSDAMRMAGIAAEQGQGGFDKMRLAMDREGTAAEIAAAKTRGLPGAIAAVQNNAEELGLTLYDKFSGPLTQVLGGVSTGIGALSSALSGVPFEVFAAGVALMGMRFTGLTGRISAGTAAVSSFGSQIRAQQAVAAGYGSSLSAVGGAVQVLSSRYAGFGRAVKSFENASTPLRVMGMESRSAATNMTGLSRAITMAKGNAQTFGGVLRGTVASGMSAVRTGASGLVGALGGPWGLAITGATAAISALAAEHMNAKAAEEAHKASQDELKLSLDETTASITNQTKELAGQKLEEDGHMSTGTSIGLSRDTVQNASMGDEKAMTEVSSAIDAATKAAIRDTDFWKEHSATLEAAGFTLDDLTAAYEGNAEARKELNRISDQNQGAIGMSMSAEFAGMGTDVRKATEDIEAFEDAIIGLNNDVTEASKEKTKELSATWRQAAEDTRAAMKVLEGTDFELVNAKTIQFDYDAATFDTVKTELEAIGLEVEKLANGKVSVEFPDGIDLFDMLHSLDMEMQKLEDGRLGINTDDPERAIALLEMLGFKAHIDDGRVVMDVNDAETASRLEQLGIASRINGELRINDNVGDVESRVKNLERTTYSNHYIRVVQQYQNAITDGGKMPLPRAMQQTGGRIPAFAEGGRHSGYRLPKTGPGTEKTDGFLGIGGDGQPTAWVDKDEWVVNSRSSEKYNHLIAALNSDNERAVFMEASRFLPAYAGGGVVESLKTIVANRFPEVQVTSDYRTTNDLHGQGKAIDVSNGFDTTPEMQEVARWFYKTFKSQLAELIHWPLNGWNNVDEGQDFDFGAQTNSEHRDHVHIASHKPLTDPGDAEEEDDELENITDEDDYLATLTGASSVRTKRKNNRILNGGSGTLIKDGSVLELAAALYSKETGQPMDDDIVSWGQATGLYSEEDVDIEELSDDVNDLREKLEDAKRDLPEAEEDLRIKKIRQQEAHSKKNATESSKASADQAVTKAERKVQELKEKIAKLEAELAAAERRLDTQETRYVEGKTSGNKVADAIILEGRRRGISDRGIKIALATGLVESELKVYANPAVPASMTMPHDAVGYDHDSVGVFQQRQAGWGTLEDRMDPAKSAGMFYDKLDDADYNTGDPGAHAQRVQVSAFPGKYAQRMDEAQALLDAFNNSGKVTTSGISRITAMAKGGFTGMSNGVLGGTRTAQINEGSAVLWAEAGPEAYIPLSTENRDRSLEIWAETGKRLGIDVMSLISLIGSGLPGLMQGRLNFSTGGSVSLESLGVNMDAASYRAQSAINREVTNNAVGAVFNGPVQINDPQKYLQSQLQQQQRQLGDAMKSLMVGRR